MMGATTSIVKGDETERKRGEEFKQIDGSKLKYNLQLHTMRKLSISKPLLHFLYLIPKSILSSKNFEILLCTSN